MNMLKTTKLYALNGYLVFKYTLIKLTLNRKKMLTASISSGQNGQYTLQSRETTKQI